MANVRKIEPTAPKLKERKRVAAYARVSIESDRLNHSLSAQVSYYSSLIQKNPEWIYAGVYADSGVSGTGTRQRSEFLRMLADCEAGKINIILTKSISRFARNVVDLLKTVRNLKSIGVEVRFEKENINSLSESGELLLSILAGFSEEESRAISDNVKWAIRKKFERGEQWHKAPFGYRWNGETFIVHEEEAAAVRVIFDNFLNDIPMAETSRWLKSKHFNRSEDFIRYALRNETYTGDLILQKYFKESHRTHRMVKNTGQYPRYYIHDNHIAIIDRETFERVQEKIRESYEFNPSAHRMKKPGCFSSKIVCGKCGSHYVKGKTEINVLGDTREHWYCLGKIRKKNCDAKNIRGGRLRKACCEAMGTDEFDESLFAKTVEKILTKDTDSIEFHLYDGTVKETKIRYFSDRECELSVPKKKPFGYKWNGDSYAIVPNEAEAVKLMYRYYSAGWKVSAISRELEAKGYQSFRGKVSHGLITQVLDSDFYMGGNTIKGQYGYELEAEHPPIVEREIFEAVQKRRAIELKKQERRINTLKKRRMMDDEKRDRDSRKPS